jgi:hypothetical protein
MDIDYEILPGSSKLDKARELVTYLERRERIFELVNVGQIARPDIAWDTVWLVVNEKAVTSPAKTQPAILAEDEQQSIQRCIETQRRNLAYVEEQIARYGMTPPLHLLNERDYIKQEIIKLEQQLSSGA